VNGAIVVLDPEIKMYIKITVNTFINGCYVAANDTPIEVDEVTGTTLINMDKAVKYLPSSPDLPVRSRGILRKAIECIRRVV